jgi:hypothetical protein
MGEKDRVGDLVTGELVCVEAVDVVAGKLVCVEVETDEKGEGRTGVIDCPEIGDRDSTGDTGLTVEVT